MTNRKENTSEQFQEILGRHLSRRQFIKTSTAAASAIGAASLLSSCGLSSSSNEVSSSLSTSLNFTEVPQGLDEHLSIPPDYEYQVLLRWGDPIFEDGEAFSPMQQSEAKQLKQFGFNNDFIGFVPLPFGSNNSDHGLLVVNHEYTKAKLMHPGSKPDYGLDREQTKIDIAAHGLSVVEIKKADQDWQVIKSSKYNKRITPNTEMRLTGPAAGHRRMKTILSKDGVSTWGTYGNCAGGVTPWGTILTAEENVDEYFSGNVDQSIEKENYQRFGMTGEKEMSWSSHFERWDIDKNPAEPLHMGWIVEIDPYSPDAKPMKRTALGRCKHEGCNVHINDDGHVVAYTGDDQKFEYIYKFVSKNTYQRGTDRASREANMRLLEDGTLYVARFTDNGQLQWLPLVYGNEKLTAENGFNSQADVVIDVRKAADLLGATPMDRPEDCEVNPVNGKVYIMLTKNDDRTSEQVNGPNSRPNNRGGQIIELIAPEGDHTKDIFEWEVLLLAGKPGSTETNYHSNTSENGWFACPDNCAFDNKGNLWIATDGAEEFDVADGLWTTELEGPLRGLTKRFLRTPIGAELCGPYFTPDNRSLFCAIQHPAGSSSFDKPDTRWPDFDPKIPARPSVVVITKKDGGVVGS